MSDQFLAEIRLVSFNFAPKGWAFCHGGGLVVGQNTALFSLLGPAYGLTDGPTLGQSLFHLPDLRGRVPLHPGQGPGLSERARGEQGGEAGVSLVTAEIPAHNHTFTAPTVSSATGTARSPQGAVPGGESANVTNPYRTGATPNTVIGGGVTGGGQPHNNMQPYLEMNYIIALQGIFPQRPS